MRDMLAGWGLWTDAVAALFGQGHSPVRHLMDDLEGMLVVHLNDLGDADIELLAKAGSRVAYCPRSSAYFGADAVFGPHRYRDLLAAGVPVALGTDSVINLPPGSVATRGICVLDEARLLLDRDGTEPQVLLEMLYAHGPASVGLELGAFRMDAGADLAGLIAVEADGPDPARGLVASVGPISFL
jgi:cytosine/adenosine deaminase-related metal-dependent hydrolase